MRNALAIAATFAALAAGIAIAQTPTPPPANPAAAAMAPAPGNVLSATCSGCHGPAGRSVAEIPAINGKTALQIQTAMLEFKTDRRPSTVMNRHAKGFSDEEIATLAAYISANWR
ncbi:MAG: c-type cytochrome [Tagaea sp.]|nr:c-type cytochrome [Tagaea sp.]